VDALAVTQQTVSKYGMKHKAQKPT